MSIVQEAIARNITVKPMGARHSQTDVICTEGIPVDNHGLKSSFLNTTDWTATFGAGVTVYEAAMFLRLNGRAFKTMPAFGNITIAGATGTGAHGSTIRWKASLSSQVVGMTIVDGLGQVRTITDENDLRAFRVHLGLLGFIVNVTFATAPVYKTLAHNYVTSDTILTNGQAIQWFRSADQLAMYWFPTTSDVVVANWTIVDPSTPGDAFTYDHVPSTYDEMNYFMRQMFELGTTVTESHCSAARSLGYNMLQIGQIGVEQTLYTQVPDFVPIYTEDGYTVENPAVGYFDKMFAPTCVDGPNGLHGLQCIWAHGEVNSNLTILDNEIHLNLDDMPAFIAALKDIVAKAPAVFPSFGVLLRVMGNSTTYMSQAYGRDSVTIEFYIPNRVDRYNKASFSSAAYQTMMQLLVSKSALL